MSSNSYRYDNMNSNINNQQNNFNEKYSSNSNYQMTPSSNKGKKKQQIQFKKLQNLKLNVEDLNTIFCCYQSREDNIFQMRVCVMQMIENVQGKTQNEIQNSLYQSCKILQETEKFRIAEENQIISKYNSQLVQPIMLENNSNAKQMVFKLGSKLNKMNNSYFQKIQFYFPRMADLIQQEICSWNSNFKESLSQIMSQQNNGSNISSQVNSQQNTTSSLYSSQGLGQRNSFNGSFLIQNSIGYNQSSFFNQNSNGSQLVTVLNHIVIKSRQKFQKEQNKFSSYLNGYSGLIERTVGIQRAVDKCNKNEKFYLDKYIQGSRAFAYIQYLTSKYLIKSSIRMIKQGLTPQIRQALKQSWKNPYDILQLEDKIVENKIPTIKSAINASQQGNNQTVSSCVSTSKTSSTTESIWEIIVTNYDKSIKEMLQNNKQINISIKFYIDSCNKRQQQQKQNIQKSTPLNKCQLNKQFQSESKLQSQSSNNKNLYIESSNSLTHQLNGESQSVLPPQNLIKEQEIQLLQQNLILAQAGFDVKQNNINKNSQQSQQFKDFQHSIQTQRDQVNYTINNNYIPSNMNQISLNSHQKQNDMNFNQQYYNQVQYNRSESTKGENNIQSKYNINQHTNGEQVLQQKSQELSGNIQRNQQILKSGTSGDQFSIRQKAQTSSSYLTQLDQNTLQNSNQITNNQIHGSNLTIEKKIKANQYLDEQALGCKDQILQDTGINVNESKINFKDHQKIHELNQVNNFYINSRNNVKKQIDYIQREKSLTFNHNNLLDNSTSPTKDKDLDKYYAHSKNRSYQDSISDYQFIRRMQSNDSQNITKKTLEIEDCSFQSSGNNPYRILRSSVKQNDVQGIEDINKIGEFYVQYQQTPSQDGFVINSGVNANNISNKQLQRVITSPFQTELTSNKASNIFLKQNANTIESINLKTSQSNLNINPINIDNIVNNKNNNNEHTPQIMNLNSNKNNLNCTSSSSKSHLIKSSVNSAQKQMNLPYIDQFNQIFESKKRNLYQTSSSTQNSTAPSLVFSNQISQNQQQPLFQNQIQNSPLYNQNNVLSHQINAAQQNGHSIEDLIQSQNNTVKNQKQSIINNTNNNINQNGINQQSNLQVLNSNFCINSDSAIKQINIQNQQQFDLNHQQMSLINDFNNKNDFNQIQNTKNDINSQINNQNSNTNNGKIKDNNNNLNNIQSNIINVHTNNTMNQSKNINTPILKTNFQLQTNQKAYSGQTIDFINNNNSSITPLKNGKTNVNVKSKRQSTTVQNLVTIEPFNSSIANTNNKEVNEMISHTQSIQPQIQNFCNLNLQLNANNLIHLDQKAENTDFGIKQCQTPQIGRKSLGADNINIHKQNSRNANKTQNEQNINQTGQLMYVSQICVQQPIIYKTNINNEQYAYSPIKPESLNARRKISQKNNQNFQQNIVKRIDNFRRMSSNSQQNNTQPILLLNTGSNLLLNGNAPTPLSSINRQKKINTVNLNNSNQFIIKKNQIKNNDNSQANTKINKNAA